MMIVEFILILLGLFVGVIAGMSGTGGGILMVPALVFLPPLWGTQSYTIQAATGISAMQALLSGISSMLVHCKKDTVLFPLLLRLIPGSITGGFLGGLVSGFIPSIYLYCMFALVLLFCLIQVWLNPYMTKQGQIQYIISDYMFSWKHGFTIALFISFLAANTGLGGAIMLLPILIYIKHVPVRNAIGTGVGFVVVTSLGSVAGKWTMNIVPFPDTALVAFGALLGGVIGAWLSHRMPVLFLRKLVVILVFIALLRILVEIFRLIA